MINEAKMAELMVPLAHIVRDIADVVRPESKDDSLDVAVGSTLAVIHDMLKARDLEDDEHIVELEALIFSLATWIYREKQTEFEQFISESAELVVLDAMRKMLAQPNESAL